MGEAEGERDLARDGDAAGGEGLALLSVKVLLSVTVLLIITPPPLVGVRDLARNGDATGGECLAVRGHVPDVDVLQPQSRLPGSVL